MVREISKIYEMASDLCELQASQPDLLPQYTEQVMQKNALQWMELFLHFADVSNPLKPFPVCKKWAWRVLDEFFEQGDEDSSLSLPVGMLNDRDKINRPGSQHGFIQFLVAPLVFSTVRIFPDLHPASTQMASNLAMWKDLWVEDAKPSDEERARSRLAGRLSKTSRGAGHAVKVVTKGLGTFKKAACGLDRRGRATHINRASLNYKTVAKHFLIVSSPLLAFKTASTGATRSGAEESSGQCCVDWQALCWESAPGAGGVHEPGSRTSFPILTCLKCKALEVWMDKAGPRAPLLEAAWSASPSQRRTADAESSARERQEKKKPPEPEKKEEPKETTPAVEAFNPEELQKRLLIAQSEAAKPAVDADEDVDHPSPERRPSPESSDDEEKEDHSEEPPKDKEKEEPPAPGTEAPAPPQADDSESSEDPPPLPQTKEKDPEKLGPWPGPPPNTERMDPRMLETLKQLRALQGGAEEQKAKRMKAATAAAEEITMSLERKDAAPPPEPQPPAPTEPAHGEVTFQAASLTNTKELSVGDMVTFEMGFDKKKNKPEATHIFKVGAGAPGGTSTSSTKDSEDKGGKKAKSRSRRRLAVAVALEAPQKIGSLREAARHSRHEW
eukprot:g31293.t1